MKGLIRDYCQLVTAPSAHTHTHRHTHMHTCIRTHCTHCNQCLQMGRVNLSSYFPDPIYAYDDFCCGPHGKSFPFFASLMGNPSYMSVLRAMGMLHVPLEVAHGALQRCAPPDPPPNNPTSPHPRGWVKRVGQVIVLVSGAAMDGWGYRGTVPSRAQKLVPPKWHRCRVVCAPTVCRSFLELTHTDSAITAAPPPRNK